MSTTHPIRISDIASISAFNNNERFGKIAGEHLTDRPSDTWPIDAVIDYIVNVHHRVAKQNTVVIYDLAQKLAYRHSETDPKLPKLVTALFLFLDDLSFHLKKEEQILFPNIRQLLKNKDRAGQITYSTFGLIKNSSELMTKEHSIMRAELRNLRELTDDFTPPHNASPLHWDLYNRMKQFEYDLLLHMSLENEVLFPKAILLDA